MVRIAPLFVAAILCNLSAIQAHASTASDQVIAAKLAGPVMVAAQAAAEEKWGLLLDRGVQRTPSAASLGDRWTPANPAWQKARDALGARLTRVVNAYGKSSSFRQGLQAAVARDLPGAESEALAKTLGGPAGGALAADLTRYAFVTNVLSSSPKEPRYDDPAFKARYEGLLKRITERHGPEIAKSSETHKAEIEKFQKDPLASKILHMISTVLFSAETGIDSSMNLLLFDDQAAIQRELDAAVASAKK